MKGQCGAGAHHHHVGRDVFVAGNRHVRRAALPRAATVALVLSDDGSRRMPFGYYADNGTRIGFSADGARDGDG